MDVLQHKDNKERTPKNVFGYFLLIINFIYSTINLFISSKYIPREELNFDYLGLLVAIMSILVTVLVGWQIFSILSFEKNAKEIISKESNKLNLEIKKQTKKTSINIKDTMEAAIATSLYHLSCSEYSQHKNDFALHLSLDSMLHCSRIKNMDDDFKIEIYEELKKILNDILDDISENRNFNNDKINEYIKSASDLDLIEIVHKISLKCKPKRLTY